MAKQRVAKTTTPYHIVQLRLEMELFQMVKEMADKEDRSVNSMLNIIVRKGIRNAKRKL